MTEPSDITTDEMLEWLKTWHNEYSPVVAAIRATIQNSAKLATEVNNLQAEVERLKALLELKNLPHSARDFREGDE